MNTALLRPADVARELGLSPARVYQKIQNNELPAIRCGRAVRIPAAAWEAFKDRQAAEALANVRDASDDD